MNTASARTRTRWSPSTFRTATSSRDSRPAAGSTRGEPPGLRIDRPVPRLHPGSAGGIRRGQDGGGDREPTLAVAQLDVAEGLDATLFAAEPTLLSPSDIDIDHKGRVWVCEVVNYRHRSGERPEGTDPHPRRHERRRRERQDARLLPGARSRHGPRDLRVLGNRVIVSVGDKVWNFYDDDGDLQADRKELMFTGIAGSQHDHGFTPSSSGPTVSSISTSATRAGRSATRTASRSSTRRGTR